VTYLRIFGAAVVAIVLVFYVVGSVRLVSAIVRGGAAGQPIWAVAGGLYLRFMVMAFLFFVGFALIRKRVGQK
jgi:hypothetical protein